MDPNDIIEEIGLPTDISVTVGKNGHSRRLRLLITGGCGYFGFKLAKTLHTLGAQVTILDLQLTPKIEKVLDRNLKFIKGDIRHYESVRNACTGNDCVYHVASFGLSGKDQLVKTLNDEVNIDGTRNVIKACQETGVNRLIYTSTYNVVLQGRPIVNGDESLPFGDPRKMVDYYSASKTRADQLVLQANGSLVAGGGTLSTCCLRPAGIYGPGERRHVERAANMIEMRIILFKIGDALVDWVHVNNLVQAHLLALSALSLQRNKIAAGKGYFVSDNAPIRCFDFLEPLFIGLGYQPPRHKCPLAVIYYAALVMECIHVILRPLINVEPIVTRTEALKLGMDHYHSMENAINDLGYKPRRYDFADVVKLYLKERKVPSSAGRGSSLGLWSKVVFVTMMLVLLISMMS